MPGYEEAIAEVKTEALTKMKDPKDDRATGAVEKD